MVSLKCDNCFETEQLDDNYWYRKYVNHRYYLPSTEGMYIWMCTKCSHALSTSPWQRYIAPWYCTLCSIKTKTQHKNHHPVFEGIYKIYIDGAMDAICLCCKCYDLLKDKTKDEILKIYVAERRQYALYEIFPEVFKDRSMCDCDYCKTKDE